MRFQIVLAISLLLCLQSVQAETSKYSYVTFYYHGGKLSVSDFIAIRTMFKSYQKMNSIGDFLVLTPEGTPASYIKKLEKDGMKVKKVNIVNAYKQSKIPADYQKTKNLLALWDLKDYKRVIFMDPYAIFVHNFDSMFDCSYLCLKDEQPLVYSNDMIVVTPGHSESRKIFSDSIETQSTQDQYLLYGHTGYYSSELYEVSQAAPVFSIGDKESNDVPIRRYYNYVNFPVVMWYEKRNWNLYSCSPIKSESLPVYSISYRYTLGHRDYFLPTHFYSYGYMWDMNELWLGVRRELQESFISTYLVALVPSIIVLVLSPWIIPLVGGCVCSIHKSIDFYVKKTHCATALGKTLVACVVLLLFALAIMTLPYFLYPASGYFFLMFTFTVFLVVVLIGLNKGTNAAIGCNLDYHPSLYILITEQVIEGILLMTPIMKNLFFGLRMATIGVEFFILIYCLYSQISPLLRQNTVVYNTLPE